LSPIQADWVLVLCSPAYLSKVRAAEEGVRVSGAAWETRLLTGRMLGGSENKVLAALARGTWAESSPDFLAGQLFYDLSNTATFGQTYRELLQRITGTYESAPPLGELPAAGLMGHVHPDSRPGGSGCPKEGPLDRQPSPVRRYAFPMERVVRVFDQPSDAEAADRAFYASLSPQQRLDMLLDMMERHRASLGEAAQRFERVCRIAALSGR
jgi:hypothetical protein